MKTPASLVLVNTGHGKGKSTAAFGTLLRAVAMGWPVAVVQFLKSGDWRVGEEKICRDLGVDWYAAGDGFTWDSDDLDESRATAKGGLGPGRRVDRRRRPPPRRAGRDQLRHDVGLDRHRRGGGGHQKSAPNG